MKKLTLYTLAASLFLQPVLAATPGHGGGGEKTASTAPAKPSKKDIQKILLQRISSMSVQEYQKAAGHKLNLGERLAFKAVRAKAKNQLKRSQRKGLFDNFNPLGFFLGLLLSIVGVLLAYIFSKDADLHKWAWIGFAINIILGLAIIL